MSEERDYISEGLRGIIGTVQDSAITEADRRRTEERLFASERRRIESPTTLSISELMSQMDEDSPERRQVAVDALEAKLDEEAKIAASKLEAENELPDNHFPAPPIRQA